MIHELEVVKVKYVCGCGTQYCYEKKDQSGSILGRREDSFVLGTSKINAFTWCCVDLHGQSLKIEFGYLEQLSVWGAKKIMGSDFDGFVSESHFQDMSTKIANANCP
jgi:hypothetical protein